MKVTNLYIGEIRKITDIKKIESKPTVYKSKLIHKTILFKPSATSKTAKDLIYGGRYKIGNYKANRVGSKYAVNLNNYNISRLILQSGHKRKNISIIKLWKIIKKENIVIDNYANNK